MLCFYNKHSGALCLGRNSPSLPQQSLRRSELTQSATTVSALVGTHSVGHNSLCLDRNSLSLPQQSLPWLELIQSHATVWYFACIINTQVSSALVRVHSASHNSLCLGQSSLSLTQKSLPWSELTQFHAIVSVLVRALSVSHNSLCLGRSSLSLTQ